jgi:hypothetical protein
MVEFYGVVALCALPSVTGGSLPTAAVSRGYHRANDDAIAEGKR